MKAFKILFIVLLILDFTVCFSQNNVVDKEVKRLKQLGKDSIIQLAKELINKDIGMADCNIKITANKTSIFVSFYVPIKYLPWNTVVYDKVGVDVVEKLVVYNKIANPIEFGLRQEIIPFYEVTDEAKETIPFIVKAINNCIELDSLDIKDFDGDLIISEKEFYYEISIISEFQEAWFNIEKVTGKISELEHAHPEPPSQEENDTDRFEEIK